MRNCMLPSDNGVHSMAFPMWYYAWDIKRMSLGHTHSLVLQKSKISGHEATGRKCAFPSVCWAAMRHHSAHHHVKNI